MTLSELAPELNPNQKQMLLRELLLQLPTYKTLESGENMLDGAIRILEEFFK